jgi:hypothetical protein
VNDDEGKLFTTAHDRFQVCCLDGCGFVSGHSDKLGAISAAERHDCARVEIYDVMARRNLNPVVWKRDAALGARVIGLELRRL